MRYEFENKGKSIDLKGIVDVVARHEKQKSEKFNILGDQIRDFSRIIWLEIHFSDKSCRRYLLKSSTNAFLQYERLKLTEKIFCNETNVFSLSPVFIENIDAVVCRYFSGNSLNAMAHFKTMRSPVRWLRRIKKASRLAGMWLRRYHTQAFVNNVIEPELRQFVDQNKESLDFLSQNERSKFLEQINSPMTDTLVFPHGDYMLHNLLFDDKQICVLDVGLSSLPIIAASWDVVTFKVSLERLWRFNFYTPLHWMPYLRMVIDKSFEEEYGIANCQSRDYSVCLMLRHFMFLETAVKRKNVRIFRWHLDEISRNLRRL